MRDVEQRIIRAASLPRVEAPSYNVPAGVQVFDPDGRSVGAIAVPGAVNLAFGGTGRIFITADTAVWAATIPDPPKEA